MIWYGYRSDGQFIIEMICLVLEMRTFMHGAESNGDFLRIFCVPTVLTAVLPGGKVWTNSISNSQRRRWRRNPQRTFQRVGNGGSPISSRGNSHPFWAGSPKGLSPSRRFPCMLRQCIEVAGLRRGGEMVFSQFEWYRGFVLLVSRTNVSWGVFCF